MDQAESEKTREKFSQLAQEKIQKRVREKISTALVEVTADLDVMIARSLGIDVRELVRSTAFETIDELFKEGD